MRRLRLALLLELLAKPSLAVPEVAVGKCELLHPPGLLLLLSPELLKLLKK